MPTLLAQTKEAAPSLGALLHNFRIEGRESTKTVSRRCVLGPVELAQLELGRAELNPDQLADAVGAYGVPRLVFPEGRSQVRVDLVAGTVSVQILETAVEETAADRTLLGYFELIFAANPMPSTTVIPFTALDLDVLRVVLSSRRNEVTRHLHRLVGPFEEPTVAPRRVARTSLIIVAAVVASLASGIAGYELASSGQPAGASIDTQIIDALVITRADGAQTVALGADNQSPPAVNVAGSAGSPIEPTKDAK